MTNAMDILGNRDLNITEQGREVPVLAGVSSASAGLARLSSSDCTVLSVGDHSKIRMRATGTDKKEGGKRNEAERLIYFGKSQRFSDLQRDLGM